MTTGFPRILHFESSRQHMFFFDNQARYTRVKIDTSSQIKNVRSSWKDFNLIGSQVGPTFLHSQDRHQNQRGVETPTASTISTSGINLSIRKAPVPPSPKTT